MLELTVPWEEQLEEANERKRKKRKATGGAMKYSIITNYYLSLVVNVKYPLPIEAYGMRGKNVFMCNFYSRLMLKLKRLT